MYASRRTLDTPLGLFDLAPEIITLCGGRCTHAYVDRAY